MNGDLAGKCARVVRELQQLRYSGVLDEVGLKLGDPTAHLPVLHFVLLKFSRHVAASIHKAGYELQGKTDHKFIEAAFKLLRDCFGIKTVLTPSNFFEQGFAERKLILISDVITACKKIHNDELRKERLAALKASKQQGPGIEARLYEPTRKTPEVKVVKGGKESRQVLSPVHLPNGTDGGHSVYRVNKVVEAPRPKPQQQLHASQAGEGAVQQPEMQQRSQFDLLQNNPYLQQTNWQHTQAAAQEGHNGVSTNLYVPYSQRQASQLHSNMRLANDEPHQDNVQSGYQFQGVSSQSSWQAQLVSRTPPGLDLTFKPPALSSLATPIHSWFVNPAFHEDEPPAPALDYGIHPTANASSMSSLMLHSSQPMSDRDNNQHQHAPHSMPGATTAEDEATTGQKERTRSFTFAGMTTNGRNPYLEVSQSTSSHQLDGAGYAASKHGHDDARGDDSSDSDDDHYMSKRRFQTTTTRRPQHPTALASSSTNAFSNGQQPQHAGGTHSAAAVTSDGPELKSGLSLGGWAHGQQSHSHQSEHGTAQHHSTHHQQPQVPPMLGQYGQLGAVHAMRAEPVVQATVTASHDSQLLQVMQQQIHELQRVVRASDEKADQTRCELQQSNDVLQARVTVLEGRVRHLEIQLEDCVRRGEYHYNTARATTSPPAARAAAGAPVMSPGRDSRLQLVQQRSQQQHLPPQSDQFVALPNMRSSGEYDGGIPYGGYQGHRVSSQSYVDNYGASAHLQAAGADQHVVQHIHNNHALAGTVGSSSHHGHHLSTPYVRASQDNAKHITQSQPSWQQAEVGEHTQHVINNPCHHEQPAAASTKTQVEHADVHGDMSHSFQTPGTMHATEERSTAGTNQVVYAAGASTSASSIQQQQHGTRSSLSNQRPSQLMAPTPSFSFQPSQVMSEVAAAQAVLQSSQQEAPDTCSHEGDHHTNSQGRTSAVSASTINDVSTGEGHVGVTQGGAITGGNNSYAQGPASYAAVTQFPPADTNNSRRSTITTTTSTSDGHVQSCNSTSTATPGTSSTSSPVYPSHGGTVGQQQRLYAVQAEQSVGSQPNPTQAGPSSTYEDYTQHNSERVQGHGRDAGDYLPDPTPSQEPFLSSTQSSTGRFTADIALHSSQQNESQFKALSAWTQGQDPSTSIRALHTSLNASTSCEQYRTSRTYSDMQGLSESDRQQLGTGTQHEASATSYHVPSMTASLQAVAIHHVSLPAYGAQATQDLQATSQQNKQYMPSSSLSGDPAGNADGPHDCMAVAGQGGAGAVNSAQVTPWLRSAPLHDSAATISSNRFQMTPSTASSAQTAGHSHASQAADCTSSGMHVKGRPSMSGQVLGAGSQPSVVLPNGTAVPSSTSELISSLMSRYSNAQTFLSEMRKKS